MASCLYEVLPTEIVWEIYEHLHRSRMHDVVEEYNKYNNYIKRNCEDAYPILQFITGKYKMGEECYTDELMLEMYPIMFKNGITAEKRTTFYKRVYHSYDKYYFMGERDYDMELYNDYDDFRMGNWSPECCWW
jgi:hypothetical protein